MLRGAGPRGISSTSVYFCGSFGMPGKWNIAQVPIGPILRHEWVLDSLVQSTKGLSRPGTAKIIVAETMRFLGIIEVGGEAEHIHFMFRTTEFNDSDVRLETGELVDGARQHIPHPVVVWHWRRVQSYAWRQTQHINVLELLACFFQIKASLYESAGSCDAYNACY